MDSGLIPNYGRMNNLYKQCGSLTHALYPTLLPPPVSNRSRRRFGYRCYICRVKRSSLHMYIRSADDNLQCRENTPEKRWEISTHHNTLQTKDCLSAQSNKYNMNSFCYFHSHIDS